MATHFIAPSGPLDAKVVVVGRDCGWHEMAEGRGFVGPAGKLIWHPSKRTGAADMVGISRHSVLVTNVLNAQPPANDWSRHDPASVVAGCESLARLLAAHPRTLVVALGEQAALACGGILPASDETTVHRQFVEHFGDRITNCRGYTYAEGAKQPTLVVCHPAFILHNWHPWWATFCWDWQKAARILQAGKFTPHEVQVEVLIKAAQIEDWWQRVAIQEGRILACDIETQGVGCVGFADTPHHAVVVPGAPLPSHLLFDQLSAILNNAKGIEFVLQNGQFDWTMLARARFVPAERWPQFAHDLMLDWHTLEPLLAGQREDVRGKGKRRTEKSLRFLASLLLDGAQWWKSYDFANDDEQFRLCGIDCAYTLGCWHELRRRFDARC